MLLAAVLAMVLAAVAPAFAQATAVGGSVQYVDCDQIQAAATGQYNVANDQDLAAVAQSLGVSQNQVSACSGSIAAGRDVNLGGGGGGGKVMVTTASAASSTSTSSASSSASASATATASASAPAELPTTGGAPVLAIGAGALLLAGGLLARRIVR